MQRYRAKPRLNRYVVTYKKPSVTLQMQTTQYQIKSNQIYLTTQIKAK